MADINKVYASARRTARSRARLRGSAERPRLAVRVSNKHISAQIIDDTTGKTLAASTSDLKSTDSMLKKAEAVGTEIAAAAKKAKVSKVVFDRGAKQYHGRMQALADAARKAGLEL